MSTVSGEHEPMLLSEYIEKFSDSATKKLDFSRDEKIQKAQVTQWIKKGFMVVNHELVSHRRFLSRHKKSKV